MNNNYIVLVITVAVIAGFVVFIIQDTSSIDVQPYRETLAMYMVEKAIADYDDNGKIAFMKFDQNYIYHNDEEYVFVIEKGTFRIVAHGINPEYIGTLSSDLIDSDGTNIGELIDKNATPEGTWVHYKFLDPKTEKIEPKSSWITLHDGYIFGVGVYSP